MILTVVGVTCAAAAVIDVAAAIYFAMNEKLLQAWLMAGNFALLGGLVQVGFFG